MGAQKEINQNNFKMKFFACMQVWGEDFYLLLHKWKCDLWILKFILAFIAIIILASMVVLFKFKADDFVASIYTVNSPAGNQFWCWINFQMTFTEDSW